MLTLKVEATCGSTIENTAMEMKALAEKTNCMVELKFNDVTLLMVPHGDVENMIENYYLAVRKNLCMVGSVTRLKNIADVA